MNFFSKETLTKDIDLKTVYNKMDGTVRNIEKKIGPASKKFHLPALLAFIFVMYSVIRYAWICDDAFHGFVIVRNFIEGKGLVYFPGERVNVSTCPFYTLVLSLFYLVSGKMYMSGMVSCLLFSAAAIWLLLDKACGNKKLLMAASALIMVFSNRTFITFTTSGLENPMLFFISALFCIILLSKKNDGQFKFKELLLMALAVGIASGTRMDIVIVYVPICIAVYFFGMNTKERWYKRWLAGFLGLLPFILWLVFSTFYYGFPFPNTAYAKLNTGIPLREYIVRGLRYLYVSFCYDPLLILIPIIFVVLSIIIKNKKYMLLSAGVLLYIVYVICIGGDFMAGRHFTLVFFTSLYCCADMISSGHLNPKLESFKKKRTSSPAVYRTALISLACLIAAISLFSCIKTIWPPTKKKTGVADERAFYYPTTSLSSYIKSHGESPKDTWYDFTVIVPDGGYLQFAPGISIYYFADGKKYYDEYGLGDDLISRIPCRYNPNWRVGHIRRTVPAGYNETVVTGVNHIEDEALAEYYDKLNYVISGDLLAPGRLKMIVDFNLGKYDYLVEQYSSNPKNFEVYYPSSEITDGY